MKVCQGLYVSNHLHFFGKPKNEDAEDFVPKSSANSRNAFRTVQCRRPPGNGEGRKTGVAGTLFRRPLGGAFVLFF